MVTGRLLHVAWAPVQRGLVFPPWLGCRAMGSWRCSGAGYGSAVVDGARLLRKDRLGRRGWGIALSVREQLEFMELCFGTYDEPADRLQVRIREQIGIVVGGYSGSADQEQEVEEAFFRRLEEASRSLALLLGGDVNHAKCWLVGQHSRAPAVEQFSGVHR